MLGYLSQMGTDGRPLTTQQANRHEQLKHHINTKYHNPSVHIKTMDY